MRQWNCTHVVPSVRLVYGCLYVVAIPRTTETETETEPGTEMPRTTKTGPETEAETETETEVTPECD